MTVVVTSFSPSGYEQYGKRFLKTFLEYWPVEFELAVYHEGQPDLVLTDHGREIHLFNLLGVSSQCAAFVQRYKDDPIVQGRKQSSRHYWKQKCIRDGYNFRFDAHKFARKVFALRHASQAFAGQRVLWLDADTYTQRNVTPAVIEALLPPGYNIARLYRGRAYHSECGMVFYNCAARRARDFLKAFAGLYASGDFLKLLEWHDSWVFDDLILKRGLGVYNIPYRKANAPFDSSEVGRYMTHLKGPLKEIVSCSA